MKKFLSVLCICICLLGLTACSKENPVPADDVETVTGLSELFAGYMLPENEGMYSYLFQGSVNGLDDFLGQGPEYSEAVLEQLGISVDGNGFISGIDSWKKAEAEIGKFVQLKGSKVEYSTKGDAIIVDMDAEFEKKDAVIEFVYEDNLKKTLTSYAVNINYTFGEKMQKAGLNTLLGMGTVFAVLILLSLLIGCFGFINKAQTAAEKKKLAEKSAEIPAKSEAEETAAAEPAQIVGGDDEIAAVIAAAIAAYESETGVSFADSDGYFVRSIRRRNTNKWKNS